MFVIGPGSSACKAKKMMLWQLKDKYLKTLYLLLWSNRITAGTSLNLWEAKFLRLNQIKSKVDVLSREKSSFSSQRKQNKKTHIVFQPSMG